MVSRREFEQKKSSLFVLDLFCALESWTNSLKGEIHALEAEKQRPENSHRERLEKAIRHGTMMPLSTLGAIVNGACRALYNSLLSVDQTEWEEVCLNDEIARLADYSKPLFQNLGSSLVVADSPRAIIRRNKNMSASLFTYVIWWILDAWPDSRISVDFLLDEEKVQVIFQDTDHTYNCKEYRGDKILLVWSTIIEYLVTVEYHGLCIWPGSEKTRKLEITIPLCPPTAEELSGPLPVWMQ